MDQLQSMPVRERAGYAGRHTVTCSEPATELYNGLLTGNGTLSMSVLGNPWQEQVFIRHEKLVVPQWEQPPSAPRIANRLKDVRLLIREGKYKEGAELADMAAAQNGCPPTLFESPAHPAIRLSFEQPCKAISRYLNTLNMRTSVISTRWEDEYGAYSREFFCSRADETAVICLKAPRGKLNVRIQGDLPLPEYTREKWESNDVPDGRSGYFDCKAVAPTILVRHETQGICLTGSYAYHRGGFATAVRVVCYGGRLSCNGESIQINEADEVLLLASCEINGLSAQELLQKLGNLPCNFDLLLERHLPCHMPLFDRLSLDLGGDPEDYLLSTVELKHKQLLSPQILPAYLEAMVDMGRFFLLCACGEFPPIYGHVNINVNLQVSAGNIGNLPEMMESYFRWIERQLPDARENAANILGTRGFFLATHPDTESGRLVHFNEYWPHHYWISSSGWCLKPFLEHYYCTGDEEFLRRRVIPLYKELALLYEDFLTERDENGNLLFIPSFSPENYPANIPVMAVTNATMDISVCREVLTVLLTYGREEGMVTDEEAQKWEELRGLLPPYLTGKYGELKEWAVPEYDERYDHRHCSHLYGAYPGDEIQPEMDRGLYEAAFIANRMRAFGNESCHGVMHRALAAARLKDAWLVHKLLRFCLESGYVNDNFTTAHNPYRKHIFPDGQGAIPTIVLECLLYSRPGFIELLPALPEGCSHRGSLKGMASRTFAVVEELTWNFTARTITLRLNPLRTQTIRLCYRKGAGRIDTENVKNSVCHDGIYWDMDVQAGVAVCVRMTDAGI